MEGIAFYNNLKISYSVAGEGKNLLFLHGFMESKNIWNEFQQVFSSTYRVIIMDLPGHGKSTTTEGTATMQRMAEAVKTVLDQLSVMNCIIVGHSMGGYISLALTEKYPELVNKLVLFHSGAHADSPEAKLNRDRAIHAVQSDHSGFVIQFVSSLFAESNIEKYASQIQELQFQAGKISKAAIVSCLEGMKTRKDYAASLGSLKIPLLIIAGKYDSRLPSGILKEQAARAPSGKFVLLENSGHMGYIEEKDRCTAILSEFFKE